MNKICDLLKLPSLEFSYIAAGLNGVFNVVKKIEILETPFPEVEKFLVPNLFIFTSFWNSKDDKTNRINLVNSMINRKCAGIGIMPGPNLHGEIDEEIINLGNNFSFPIMYIPPHVRWCDIISEFSLATSSIAKSDLDFNFVDILNSFSDLHIERDLKKFCYLLNQFLSIPIIINADSTHFNGIDGKTVSTILSKIYSVKMQNLYRLNMPITLNINNQNLSVVYYGNNSILATYISSQNITNTSLQVFSKIAPIIIKELDTFCNPKASTFPQAKINLNTDDFYYMVLLRKENISSIRNYISSKYTIYEENDLCNYITFLIPKNTTNEINIYSMYNEIIEKTAPILFIFSSTCYSAKELYNQTKMLKYTVSSLLFLNGIFSIDELPLLNMVHSSPYEYKEIVFKMNSTRINIGIEQSFFDTLRLYLVLKNINDVSSLLGIHSNSVKYRISKCFKMIEDDSSNILGDLPHIKILLLLEILKLEDSFI